MQSRHAFTPAAAAISLLVSLAASATLAGEAGKDSARSKPPKFRVVDEKAEAKKKLEEAARKRKAKVAVVNGAAILREDLDREVTRARHHMMKRGIPAAMIPPQIETQALEGLIDREILYQESRKKKIAADEAAITKEFDAVKSNFRSEELFEKAMAASHMTKAELRSKIGREIALKKYVDTEFVGKAVVPEKDIKTFYDGNPKLFEKPERVKASHILVKVGPTASEADKNAARKKIEAVRKRLADKEDFATVAKEISQCGSASRGGDLGYRGRGAWVKPFEEAAFALNAGDTSGIVETRFGYHIIKVFDKQAAGTVSFEEAKSDIADQLKQKKVQETIEEFLEKAKQTAKIERLLP
jgi:peptidyl-prolyl cis-trans isomerase C